ncbi:hypothetical protein EGI22_07735 [Lacihabitans sp. LS3-19]|uniref:protein-disulfide reductase DsbD domain-containing protein n=1 Tax=Lacihabitans sp. LS3-19 TaxID=2487335 RepID=UPI0020CDE3FC|nr:protein-disulfide reductase DsbD domain-containing protein [Lacihabitans sp. LS3-19]MCP9767801.1 hypothetical protein [Lacihabitans sp. LS3-19]
MRIRFLVVSLIFSLSILSFDIVKPVKWTFTSNPSKAAVGSTVDLVFSGKIDKEWYIYSSELKVEGPSPTEVQFVNNGSFQVIGKLIPVNPKEKYDEIWGGKVNYYVKEAKFIQKVKILKSGALVEGKLINQACTVKDGSCVTNKDKFSFKF